MYLLIWGIRQNQVVAGEFANIMLEQKTIEMRVPDTLFDLK